MQDLCYADSSLSGIRKILKFNLQSTSPILIHSVNKFQPDSEMAWTGLHDGAVWPSCFDATS